MKSWWNALTSSNRHADSKRESYNPSFTSIRTGLTNDSVTSLSKGNGYTSYDVASPSSSQLNLSTYSTQYPGLLRRDTAQSFGGMPMQDFQDGVAPPPPVADSWRRIDRWAEENYPELYDQLSYGATEADVDELEHTLQMSLPADVRESFYIHDGQERGGRPTGLFFGVALLDCEELVDEYDLWKKVAASLPRPSDFPQHLTSSGSSSYNPNSGPGSRRIPSGQPLQAAAAAARKPRQAIAKQGSRPEGTVQAVYSHPGWIPMAKDYMGNNIAIDLSPGSKGRVGQVILFGRECDIKYVVAPSWAAFLASFVSDLESNHVVVDEDVGVGGEMGQLRYVVDLDQPEEQYSYFETLKARVRRRDRAVRSSQSRTGSTTSLTTNGTTRKNGKGRAPSPLKSERLAEPSLTFQNDNSSRDYLTSPKLNGGGVVLDRKEKLTQSESRVSQEAAPLEKPIIATPQAEAAAEQAAAPVVPVVEESSTATDSAPQTALKSAIPDDLEDVDIAPTGTVQS